MMLPNLHNDREIFITSIENAAIRYGFANRLVEKDYYCSLILGYLYQQNNNKIIFKGGTCLNKVYAGFYRMSEDLDFSISTEIDSKRAHRRGIIEPYKGIVNLIKKTIPEFTLSQPLKGYNNSTQYIAYLEYNSVVTGMSERIKIEIGLREPFLDIPVTMEAKTLIEDPFSGEKIDLTVTCMSLKEVYAEKVRAALTRREPAIRDYYDLWYAVNHDIIDEEDRLFISMINKKLSVPGTDFPSISNEIRIILKRQIETELKTVLRVNDFKGFKLDEALHIIGRIYNNVSIV